VVLHVDNGGLSLSLAAVPDFKEVVGEPIHLVLACLSLFSVNIGCPQAGEQEVLGGLLVVDLILSVHVLDHRVSSDDVLHYHLLAILADVSLALFSNPKIQTPLIFNGIVPFLEPPHFLIVVVLLALVHLVGDLVLAEGVLQRLLLAPLFYLQLLHSVLHQQPVLLLFFLEQLGLKLERGAVTLDLIDDLHGEGRGLLVESFDCCEILAHPGITLGIADCLEALVDIAHVGFEGGQTVALALLEVAGDRPDLGLRIVGLILSRTRRLALLEEHVFIKFGHTVHLHLILLHGLSSRLVLMRHSISIGIGLSHSIAGGHHACWALLLDLLLRVPHALLQMGEVLGLVRRTDLGG